MQLGGLDSIVLCCYAVLLGLVAWRVGRSSGNPDEYFFQVVIYHGGQPPAVLSQLP